MSSVLRCSGYELVKTDMVYGEGCYLFDSRGNRFLDLEAGDWGAALGHSHPRINEVLCRQSQQLMHIGFTYSADIVERGANVVLDALGIDDGKCVFLSSGSEAVEFAVQLALRISGKPLLLTMVDSFLASYGSAGTKPSDQWHCFDWTGCQDCPRADDCDPDCEKISAIPFEQLAAWVFEPGSSSGLVRFPPRGLIRVLGARVRQAGGIVIVNEVTTGLGRTGKWFGHQHYGLEPDIVALGKGLGNGYPVSAAAMDAEIADSLAASGFRYAQSHQNDPLGCAVAEVVIDTLRTEDVVDAARRRGEIFHRGLENLAIQYACIEEVRGRGLMSVLQFDSQNTNESARNVFRELLELGIIVGCKPDPNLLRFLPPLIISDEDVEKFLATLESILKNV